MSYPEFFIAPMRQELTQLGVRELRTAADVETSIRETQGTLMIVVNSVCGCAAGKARPGVALALQHTVKPDVVATVRAPTRRPPSGPAATSPAFHPRPPRSRSYAAGSWST